ncbi:hypothetical protein PI125_g19170 [Phytophthora idaei]|nr:hypothetical protein PI125_g19170 [Phytophthora idaei]
MDSDVEGDSSESENWYFEDHGDVEDEAESEELRDEEEGAGGGDEEGEETDSAENHLDGAAIIARHKKNEGKRLASKRPKEAVAKLPPILEDDDGELGYPDARRDGGTRARHQGIENDAR